MARAAAVLVVAVAAASAHYTVKPGDTLAAIATDNEVSVTDLAAANGISDSNRIRIGQQLVLPSDVSPASASVANEGGYHWVEPGESLDAIASRHGISVEMLAAANGITDPSALYAGTRLRLSGSAFVAGPVSGETTYMVASGDSLGWIAALHGTTVAALATLNDIHDPNQISVGARLRVPSASWVCPVAGASYFNDWGFLRSGGRTHEGTDLFASRGTEVKAPVGGTVEQLHGQVGGFQFRLYGDDGHLYLGSHMDSAGQDGRVTAGAVIGFVGDSGNAVGSRPHLHFEIHPNGGPAANPYPSLEANGC